MTTIAGSAGETGEADGTGSAARLRLFPGRSTSIRAATFRVADTNNQLIRKITPSGVVTTIAGHADSIGSSDGLGTASFTHLPSGIVYDVLTGGLYFTDRGNQAIRYLNAAMQT